MATTSQDASLRKLLTAEPIPTLVRRAASSGVEVHLVGGAVRDHLLGRESHDYDIVVSHSGRELAEGIARDLGARFVPLGGKEFASFRVVAGRLEGESEPDWELDIWDREGGTLEADLARRDFTVNSVALTVGKCGAPHLVDPFSGVADLERRRLRATTFETFTGDPLRVLRLPRFLVQLDGFKADVDTVALARRAAPGLARVAVERIRDELDLIFRRDGAERGAAVLLDLGVYPSLWLSEPEAPVDDEAARRAALAVDHLGRLADRVAEVVRLAPQAPPVDVHTGRWALTFVAFKSGRTTAEVVAIIERFREKGLMTRDLAARVTRLVAESEIPPDERGRRRFLHRLGRAWSTAISILGTRFPDGPRLLDWRRAVSEIAVLVATDGAQILTPQRLLSGEDVQHLLGVPPGPQIGQALDRIRLAQVEGEVTTEKEAVAYLLASEQKDGS